MAADRQHNVVTIAADSLRLRAVIATRLHRPFVRFRDRAYTYGEFDMQTDEVAGGMSELLQHCLPADSA